MTQKIKNSPIHGMPTTMATFSQASPSAIIPQKLSIQYTTNVPLPYATGLPSIIFVTCVSLVMELVCQKLIWKAMETKE